MGRNHVALFWRIYYRGSWLLNDAALTELQKLDSIEALAVLGALEKKRKEETFVRYWRPYDKQGEVLKLFTSELKIFGVLGGNRSGKTELGAVIATAWALGKDFFKGEPAWEFIKDLPIPEPPNNIWVVGLDFPTLRDVIWGQKLRSGRNHPGILPRNSEICEPKDGDFRVPFANGSLLTCKSADSGADKFQGASVDLVWIDEECEAGVYNECYQRTLDCGGRIVLTLTPLTDINSGVREPWVFDLYEEWKRGSRDIRFGNLSLLDNPFVPANEKERAIEKWAGHYEERARLYGEFIRRSGLVYPMWDRARHCCKPFTIPKSWPRYVSIDPAASGTTAVLWAAVSPEDTLYLYKEYYEKDLIISDHVKNIKIRTAGDPIDIWLIDPFFGRQKNAETHKTNTQLYREAGLPVRQPEIGDDYGLNVSREYLNATVTPNSRHPKLYVFEGLSAFEEEIKFYCWDFFQAGEMKGQSKDKPRKRKDHLMNALQYLCSVRPKGNRRGDTVLSKEERLAEIRNNTYSDVGPISAEGEASFS